MSKKDITIILVIVVIMSIFGAIVNTDMVEIGPARPVGEAAHVRVWNEEINDWTYLTTNKFEWSQFEVNGIKIEVKLLKQWYGE